MVSLIDLSWLWGQAIGSLHRLPGLNLGPQPTPQKAQQWWQQWGAVQTGRQYGVFAQLLLGQYVFCFHPVFDPGECQSYHWEAKRHIQVRFIHLSLTPIPIITSITQALAHGKP